MREPRARRWAGHLVAMAIGVLLIEGLLQGAAWVYTPLARDRAEARGRGEAYRVLCLGDSNTYGLYLRPEQAWPARLGEMWRSRGEAPLLDVVNLGYPGTNSTHVLRDLPEMLRRLQPDLVILMIGVNDFWTRPVSLEEGADGRGPLRRLLQDHSRLYRLGWAVVQAVRLLGEEEEEEERAGFFVPLEPEQGLRLELKGAVEHEGLRFDRSARTELQPLPPTSRALGENALQIAAGVRAAGSEILLATYPAANGYYRLANRAVRKAARRQKLPLLDLERLFAPVCPREPCPEWLFPDRHPTERGHRRIAELLADRLPSVLSASAGASGASVGRSR